jgi:signal transduction histidine kinase/CHASE3 domain sensor protein
MKLPLRAIVAAAMGVSLLLLVAVSFVAYRSNTGFLETEEWVRHAHEILDTSHRLFIALEDVESSHRGYALSGDRRYLTSLPISRGAVPPLLAKLREITADNPRQAKRRTALEGLIEEKLDWNAEVVRRREKEGLASAVKLFDTNQGKLLMSQVVYLMREIEDEEDALLAARLTESRDDARRTSRNVILISFFGVLMNIGWIVLIFRGIGQAEQSASDLSDSEHRLNLALDSAKMGAWDMDLRTDKTVRTLRHDQIFGYETMQPDWGLGRFTKEHVAPADQALVTQAFAEANKTGVFRLECPIIRQDGIRRWVLIEGTLYRDSRGEPSRMMGIVTDNTLEKEKAADLLRAVAQLAAANKELETFSYSVSHDLRAPLRSIDGFSQAVLEDNAGTLNAESVAHLARVRLASQRMAQLIDDMLEMARVSRVEMRMARVDLSALADAALIELARAEPDRSVETAVTPGLHAEGDERLLRLALTNLLSNAWKFTSKSPTARIEFSSFLQPDGTPAFYVRDNGAGFDPVYAHKLFGAFQRLHTEFEFPGTGVGLATVQRVVHRHGGRIWAESAVGKGATFYFTIEKTKERIT